MGRKSRNEGKLGWWLGALPDGTTASCPDCKVTKEISEFWHIEARKLSKRCYSCIKSEPARSSKYKLYIASPEWRCKREEYWKSGVMRECYVCGDPWVDFKGKQLHHRTYERLGNENLDDLVPVCVGCHQDITDAWKVEKAKNRKARKTLWEITDIVASERREEDFIRTAIPSEVRK